ncbi:S8 family serine peptidase [Neobacillus sp. NPDC093127]|uniref:S8 family serine peptidase n=1 Tax=Neobacillus sp. NPDC093127 TaxID=3364296 RepID=UPI00382FEEB8
MRSTKRFWAKACMLLLALVMTLSMALPANSLASSVIPADTSSAKGEVIDAKLLKKFEKDEFARFIVVLRDQADTEKISLSAKQSSVKKNISQKEMKANVQKAVVQGLQDKAKLTQKGINLRLKEEKASGKIKEFHNFFIINGISVTGTKESAAKLAELPEVKAILLDEKQTLEPIKKEEQSAKLQADESGSVEWNIERVGAHEVWARGITGEGTVVANIDSGVAVSHPALKTKYRGYDPNNPDKLSHTFNWYDAIHKIGSPVDSDGHGTHTMGTMVGQEPDGQNQIGVAPGAKWIAARAFANDESYDSYIIQAAEWVLAPTDEKGVPHPEMAPDVVNNSWGGRPINNDWFRPLVQAWRSVGIFPVFSVGNTDFFNPVALPGTASSPANYPESFAVGATTNTDELASFSLRGPTERGDVKPDISAPGVGIRSSLPGATWNTFEYGSYNGTSMAAPHIAAAALLLKQADPALSLTQIEDILKLTAVTKTDENYPEAPNNGYGYGIVNVNAAVKAVEQGIGKIKGQVVGPGNDTEAPTYVQDARHVVYEGLNAPFSIQAMDNISVNQVSLHVRYTDASEAAFNAKRYAGDYRNGLYEAIIPAEAVKGSTITYWWTIQDFSGNQVKTAEAKVSVKDGIRAGYFEDFESLPEGWSSYGINNSWEWGVSTYGPKTPPPSGKNVIATNLRGQTEMFSNMTLVMPPVIVEGETQLRFKQWYNMGFWDYGTVFVTADGKNWDKIYQITRNNENWHEVGIDLSKYAGKKITIAFNLQTDDGKVPGWYLDDMQLVGSTPAGGADHEVYKEIKLNSEAFANPVYPLMDFHKADRESQNAALLPVDAGIKVVETDWKTKSNPQNGEFVIDHPPGKYTVEVQAYGYKTQTQKVTVSSKGEVNPKITLEPLPRQTISGTVTDTSGKALKDATILLLEDEKAEPGHSGENGDYQLKAYEGSYTVKVFAKDHYSKTLTIDVKPGKNLERDIQLSPFINKESGEIKYDNGSYNKNLVMGNAGSGFAVKMSLKDGETSAKLKGAKLQFWAGHIPVPGGDDILISVYDAKGKNGAPGNKLAGPIKAKAQRNLSKWTEVDLSNLGLVVKDDFYITYLQADDYPYVPGFVSDGDKKNWAGRSWDYFGGQWFKADQSVGNYMIRAVVDYGAQEPFQYAKAILKNTETSGDAPFDIKVKVQEGSEEVASVDYQLSSNADSDADGSWKNVNLPSYGGDFTTTVNDVGTWYLHVKVKDKAGNEEITSFGPFEVKEAVTTELEVSPASLDMKVGATEKLTVKSIKTQGDKVTETDVTELADYSGFNAKIIKVEKGKVTTLSAGETSITIKFGEHSKTVTVKVEPEASTTLSVSPASLELKKGNASQLKVKSIKTIGDKVTETDVTNLANYSGFDSKIVKVENGLVKALAPGSTSITITYGADRATVLAVVGADKHGWQKENGQWFYYDGNGNPVTGWLNDSGKWYYMNGKGIMLTGWQYVGGTWYYLQSSGAMQTGWLNSGGTWYYLTKSGAMQTGWLNSGGTWYYLAKSGAMQTGWLNSGGTWYYLAKSGAMQTGWLNSGGTWYYLAKSGAMKTGWLLDGSNWYYLKNSGAMVTGWFTINGKRYFFNQNGKWVK